MSVYAIFDTMNCFMRAKHSIKESNPDMKVGLAVHLLLNTIMQVHTKFNPDSLVFCFEGNSWRKQVYPPYKATRALLKLKKTPQELEEDELFFEALNDFKSFIKDKTNSLCLQHDEAEADDMVARFIALHPNDTHIIVSTDADFVQLVKSNVMIYDGMKNIMIMENGVFTDKGDKIEFSIKNNGKLKVELNINEKFQPPKDWIDYCRFCKIVRGESGMTSDNIFPVLPGIRQKSSKNKDGIDRIFEDRKTKGFVWNNFMNTQWVDDEGKTRIVKDEFFVNELIVDLSQIPEMFSEKFDQHIRDELNKPLVQNIGIHFMAFTDKYNLSEYAKSSNNVALALSKYTTRGQHA